MSSLHPQLKVRGTSLYPQAIFSVLDSFAEVQEYYVEVRGGADLSDEVTVHVALAGDQMTGADVARKLGASLRVAPAVVVEPLEAVRDAVSSPNSRKPVRVVDRRTGSA